MFKLTSIFISLVVLLVAVGHAAHVVDPSNYYTLTSPTTLTSVKLSPDASTLEHLYLNGAEMVNKNEDNLWNDSFWLTITTIIICGVLVLILIVGIVYYFAREVVENHHEQGEMKDMANGENEDDDEEEVFLKKDKSRKVVRKKSSLGAWLTGNSTMAIICVSFVILALAVPTEAVTSTPTPTQTPSQTSTKSITSTQTGSPTQTPTNTPSTTGTGTPSQTPSKTGTPSQTPTQSPSNTGTSSPSQTQTPSNTGTPSGTPSNTGTPSGTPSNTGSASDTPTGTPSQTQTGTPTGTRTQTPTQSPTNSPTQTPSETATQSPTQSPSNTPSPSTTSTATESTTASATVTPTATPSPQPQCNYDSDCPTSACIENVQCVGGQCQHTDVNCDDSNPCTNDFCNTISGCHYVNVEAGVSCLLTPMDYCKIQTTCDGSGTCSGIDRDCTSANLCLTDTCLPALGCVYSEVICPSNGDRLDLPICVPTTGKCVYPQIVPHSKHQVQGEVKFDRWIAGIVVMDIIIVAFVGSLVTMILYMLFRK